MRGIYLSFLCIFAACISISGAARAQQWTGVLDPSRAVDWTKAGVVGGIPSGSWSNCTTAACNTLSSGTVTGSSINSAVSSAPNNSVVQIPAGSFTISDTCINITRSNVALRGAGADQTKLTVTALCTGGGLGTSRAINLMSGASGVGCGSSCGGASVSGTANWTAGYAKNTTSITLSNVSGLVAGAAGVGSIIFLDQLDDATGTGYPTVNDVIQCSVQDAWCSNKGGGNNWGRPGRSLIQAVSVTAISGTGPFTVTISPGVSFPTIRASQSPGAWWNNSQIHNTGIENMSLDLTSADGGYGIFVKDGSNLWISGTRQINTASGTGAFYGDWIMYAAHVTLRSNYFYGKNTTCNPFPLENYSIAPAEVSDSVVENTIFHHTNNAYVPNDPEDGNVFAYNFVVGSIVGGAGAQPHGGMEGMDLYEGNDWASYYGDVTHGTHMFETLYRNLFTGTANNNSCTVGQAITYMTNNRFGNVIANVIGNTSYSRYEENDNNTASATNAVFEIGWIGDNSGTAVGVDSNVKRTLMRWGNWDMFSSTNRTATNDLTGVHWCGSAVNTAWLTTCAGVSEIPAGITSYANLVPTLGDAIAGQGALAPSFYLASKPSWFGSAPWPAIGPDVSNGTATNTATTPTGGHANLIPARVCYNSLSTDSAYGSLGIKVFNAATCYSSSSAGQPPAPPTTLSAVVQ